MLIISSYIHCLEQTIQENLELHLSLFLNSIALLAHSWSSSITTSLSAVAFCDYAFDFILPNVALCDRRCSNFSCWITQPIGIFLNSNSVLEQILQIFTYCHLTGLKIYHYF